MRPLTTALFALTLAQSTAAEGTGHVPPVAEIVTFRLIDGADPVAFVKAANALGPFLRSNDDFVSRTLSVDETGVWTDHILWSSQAGATRASQLMFDQPEAKPFLAFMKEDGVNLRYAAVRMQQE